MRLDLTPLQDEGLNLAVTESRAKKNKAELKVKLPNQ
jgi:hypothetical protein